VIEEWHEHDYVYVISNRKGPHPPQRDSLKILARVYEIVSLDGKKTTGLDLSDQ